MLRWLLVGLLFVMLPACGVRRAEPAGSDAFRLMSYNVNWGGDSDGATLAVIRAADADIVCLQETTEEWKSVLTRELGGKYPHVAFRQSAGRKAGGLAILSKYPVTDIAYLPSETTWFDGWVVRVETPAGAVQLINVHLQPPATDAGGFSLGSLLLTNGRRQREIERLYEKTSAEKPLVIAGDFNDDERSGVVRSLERRGMTSALGEFDSATPTWRWPAGLLTLERRMDHVMYRGVHCYQAYVIKGGRSDHWPVVAVLGPKVSPGTRGR